MNKFYKPNFKKSNLNISATLAEFLGAENHNKTLKILEKELKKDYKNVVFICLDGFGINPMKINLDKDAFLRKNIKKTLLSTFPSTTTNATTSLITNLLPLEHGWFGWSLYFDEIKQTTDLYLHCNSKTGEKLEYNYPIKDNTNCYFDNTNSDYQVTAILPDYVKIKHEENKITMKDETDEFELCDKIKKVCTRSGKQFIYSYLSEPDSIMHEFGVSSKQAKRKIESINQEIEKLYNSLDDTLIIITADHGQIDISGYIEFYKDKEMNDMLEVIPFLDARSPAFIVKKGKEKEFEKTFKKKYGKDFKLYKSADLIKKGYFGEKGEYGYLLGSFIAIGTNTNKLFLSHERTKKFLGHHTSLTEEMLVPLIMLTKK